MATDPLGDYARQSSWFLFNAILMTRAMVMIGNLDNAVLDWVNISLSIPRILAHNQRQMLPNYKFRIGTRKNGLFSSLESNFDLLSEDVHNLGSTQSIGMKLATLFIAFWRNRVSSKYAELVAPNDTLLCQHHFALLETLVRESELEKRIPRSGTHLSPLNLIQRDTQHTINFEFYPRSLSETCAEDSGLELLILVLSSPSNIDRRNSIRQTWANPDTSKGLRERKAKVFFIVGNGKQAKEEMQSEIDVHDDIIIVDVKDTYMNIVYKVFSIIHIAGIHCAAPFTLKVDEDVVFHIDRFLERIHTSFFPDRADIYCHVYHDKAPLRQEWLEWYVSPEQYPGEMYPDFCAGPAYVMTRRAAQQIMNNTQLLPDIQVEDVLITGLISEEAGVNRFAYQQMFERDNYVRRKCSTLPDGTPKLIAKHGFKTHAAMETAWKRIFVKTCSVE